MYLRNISDDTEISLFVHKGDKIVRLHQRTPILSQADKIFLARNTNPDYDTCVMKMIMHSGQAVRLNAPGVTYHCLGIVNDVPYFFKNVKVSRLELPDAGLCELLRTTERGEKHDRRANFRLYLGIDGDISISKDIPVESATIKDISLGGIGVIVPKTVPIELGKDLTVTFRDYSALTHTSSDLLFNLEARPVRIEDADEDNYIVGCTLLSYNETVLNKYIMFKQREIKA